MVGTFGNAGVRALVVTASARTTPELDVLHLRWNTVDQHGDASGQKVRHDSGISPIGNVHDVDPGSRLEQLAGQMNRGSRARRSVAEFARIGLRQRDELLQVARGKRRIDDQHGGEAGDQRDRSEVAQPVIRQILAHGRAHHPGDRVIEQGIAVGCRAHDRIDADGAARAALVLDHHLLPQHVGKLLCGRARGEVDAAARSQRDDQLDRLCRITVLRRRNAGRQARDDGTSEPNQVRRGGSSFDHGIQSFLPCRPRRYRLPHAARFRIH